MKLSDLLVGTTLSSVQLLSIEEAKRETKRLAVSKVEIVPPHTHSYIGSVNLNNLKNIEHADLNANCATEIEKSQSRFHKLSDNQKVEKTCQHLKYTCEIFNKYAETLNLMMRLDCTEIVNDIQRQWKRKQIAPEVRAYCDGRSSKGILHENELNALANITFELEHNIIPIILALGKTNSGKTTTSFSLEFCCVYLYLQSWGQKRLFPMYLGTHLLSQTASMKESQNTFRKIYQNIEVRHIKNKEAMKLSEYNIDTYIENLITNEKTINDKNLQSLINDDIMIDDKTNKETYENLSVHATIQTYHDRVLQQLLKDNYYTYDNAFNAINKIHTRTASHDKKSEFQNVYKNIIAADCHIFLIIDEPQYGPTITGVMSDWLDCFKKDTNGDIIYDDKNPVINPDSIFQQILDYNTHNRCIAFSATGYELFHRKDIKTIKLKLSELYSGFNWYYGDVFDKDVNITPPTVYAVSDVLHSLASQNGNDPLIKFLHHFSRAIYYSKNREKYAKKIKSLNRKLKKLGIPEYTGNWDQYKIDFEQAFARIVNACIENGGIMMARVVPANAKTKDFITKIQPLLNGNPEIMEYFGDGETESESESEDKKYKTRNKEPEYLEVKLHNRADKTRPCLILVTARARMAEDVPNTVKYFFELTDRCSTMNALEQGLLGRACGYNKQSIVILSDYNKKEVFDKWIESKGMDSTIPHGNHTERQKKLKPTPTIMILKKKAENDPIYGKIARKVFKELIDHTQQDLKNAASLQNTKKGKKEGIFFTSNMKELIHAIQTDTDFQNRLGVNKHFIGSNKILLPGVTHYHNMKHHGESVIVAITPKESNKFAYRWADSRPDTYNQCEIDAENEDVYDGDKLITLTQEDKKKGRSDLRPLIILSKLVNGKIVNTENRETENVKWTVAQFGLLLTNDVSLTKPITTEIVEGNTKTIYKNTCDQQINATNDDDDDIVLIDDDLLDEDINLDDVES